MIINKITFTRFRCGGLCQHSQSYSKYRSYLDVVATVRVSQFGDGRGNKIKNLKKGEKVKKMWVN